MLEINSCLGYFLLQLNSFFCKRQTIVFYCARFTVARMTYSSLIIAQINLFLFVKYLRDYENG